MIRHKPLLPGTKRMRSGRSTGKPTKAEASRLDAIKQRTCVVAHLLGMAGVYCEVQHLTLDSKHGAKRQGHMQTVGLNPYSHRGVPFNGWTMEQCGCLFGPSLAIEPNNFRALYPDALLLQTQDEVLALPVEAFWSPA